MICINTFVLTIRMINVYTCGEITISYIRKIKYVVDNYLELNLSLLVNAFELYLRHFDKYILSKFSFNFPM